SEGLGNNKEPSVMDQRHSARILGTALAAGGLALSGLVALPVSAAAPTAPSSVACDQRNNNTYDKLLGCVTADGVMEHLAAFQAIADANDGNRAEGTSGYSASVDYVVETMQDAGWDAEAVPFDYIGTESALEQITPVQAAYPHSD